jgi:hypothetical protein
MSIEVVRITDNPAYRVRLGLDPAQTIERITLDNGTIASLPVDAQKHLARLFERNGSPLVMQWYDPIPARVSLGITDERNGSQPLIFSTVCYDASALPVRLAAPTPFTVDLVVEWLEDLASEARKREEEVTDWFKSMCHTEYSILQSTDQDACFAGLTALTEGHNYVYGPYGAKWWLSEEGTARLIRIEADRRIASEAINKAAKEARKKQRADFVAGVVAVLGSDSQKERLGLGLLPMHEIEILLHEHVLNGAYKRLCEDENLEVAQEAVRLPAGAFEIFKIIKSHVDTAEIRWVNDYGHPYPIGEIKICPVVGYETSDNPEFDSKGERRLLCEVRICDDPAHSDWSSEAVYYLD